MMACREFCTSKKCGVLTIVLGVLMFLAGVGLLGGFIIFTKNSVINDVQLVPGTTAYDGFEEMVVPMRMQFWLWNIVNPQEFLNGAKPIMEERGPYTYLEYRYKDNITHDHDGGTVYFRGMKTYRFVQEESVGPETDTFFTVNVPVFTVANLLKDAPGPIKNIQRMIHELSNATSVLELTVYDILWGYEDAYLELFDELFPGQIPSTLFGLFQGTNATITDTYVLQTGEKDIKKVGHVVSWNGMAELDYWGTEWANTINGTDGSTASPFRTKDDKFYIFVSTFCRSGYLEYAADNELEGLETGRYYIAKSLFDNATVNPDNLAFCYPDESNCPPTGVITGEPCKSGAPIYFSLPHFLYADQSLLDGVIGMKPNEKDHILTIDVQMLTGVVFGLNNRAQINLKVQPYSTVPDSILMPTTYVPIVWLNESSVIDAESAEAFKDGILVPLLIAKILIGLLLGIGVLLITGGIVGYCCICKNDKPTETLPILTSATKSFDHAETNFTYGTTPT